MALDDIEELLNPINDESPCGEDLEYDVDFLALTQAYDGEAEQVIGNQVKPAVPANWPLVSRLAFNLFNKTRDLRIATYWTRAQLELKGYSGFCSGIELIAGLVEHFWDTLHPQLDAADDNDPTMRINTLASLCDRERTLGPLAKAPLCQLKELGCASVHDVQLSRGDPGVTADPKVAQLDSATVHAILMESPLEQLKETLNTIEQSEAAVQKIDSILLKEVGATQTVDFSPLLKQLKVAASVLNDYLTQRGEAPAPPPEESAGETMNGDLSAQSPAAPRINSREDAARKMDEISAFYRENEPSSPIPLLMERAKRLSKLGFLEILKDIAPDGLSQAQSLSGLEKDNKS